MNNIQNKQMIKEMSQMTKINSKYPKKNEEKYIAYRGLILFTKTGRAIQGELSRFFFKAFCDVMGNPMNRTEKKQRSNDYRKTNEKKHGANSPIF